MKNDKLSTLSGESAKKAAIAAHRKEDLESASQLYYRALIQLPEDVEIWTNLGILFRSQKLIFQSFRAQKRAFDLVPDKLSVCLNFANILDDIGQHEKAIELRKQLVNATPDNVEAHVMLIRSLRLARQMDAAEQAVAEALHLFPDNADILFYKSTMLLSQGRYADGFLNYLWRFETDQIDVPTDKISRWTGQNLDGKRVLVLPEQGFGDTINFTRFLPHLKSLGATVHLVCRPPVLRLLQRVKGADAVIEKTSPGAEYDYWTTALDIPVDYFLRKNEIPEPVRLTLPDPAKRRAQKMINAHQSKLRIGCVWAGSEGNDRNTMRSFSHQNFLPLAKIPGIQMFSLYKGPRLDSYYKDGTAAFVLDTASTDQDLADCAATVAEMDIIITADTVTAHIAGSLGIEVWNLLHWEPFWLYGTAGDQTDWYPSMTLIRQSRPNDWNDVFKVVERKLLDRLATRSGDGT
ncbi:MAG: tetratricopeptide repeat protein [Paracoccaceae bacterium]